MNDQYESWETEEDEMYYEGEEWGAWPEENRYGFAEEPGPFDDSAELAEALRDVLDEEYQEATTEELEDALFNMLGTMDPAEGISFTKALRAIGEAGKKVLNDPTVAQVAGTALPWAGKAFGTVYGGPVGAAVGGQLGQMAGQAFTVGRKVAPAAKPTPSPAPTSTSAAPVPGGSPAATQVLELTQNPDMLRALLAAALGPYGQKTVQVGQQGPAVNLGPFMGMLSTLAGQAAAEAEDLLQGGAEMSEYMFDSEGEYVVDPAVPEERALALYGALTEAEEERLFGEEPSPAQPWTRFFPFAKGARLLVEYETPILNVNVGKAWVLEHQPNTLKVRIHIDAWDRFNVPETEAVLAVEYAREGPGNLAAVRVNGQTFSDKNVTIHSGGNTREILLSISILGQRVDKITLTKDNANKARIIFKAQGSEQTLVLSRD